MITGSYFRRRRRLTILEPDETKFAAPLTLLTLSTRSPVSWPWYRSLICTNLRVVSMEHLQWMWNASRERLPFLILGLVPLFWTYLCSNCWYQFSRTYRVFSRLFTLNTPRYFVFYIFDFELKTRTLNMTSPRCLNFELKTFLWFLLEKSSSRQSEFHWVHIAPSSRQHLSVFIRRNHYWAANKRDYLILFKEFSLNLTLWENVSYELYWILSSSCHDMWYSFIVQERQVNPCIRSVIHTVFALNGKETTSRFNPTYRYIDDVLSINPEFEYYLGQLHPVELEIIYKDTKESTTSASYLNFLLSIGRDGKLHISIYNKREDFNFHITNFPFLRRNIPSSPAYGVIISQLIR